MVNEKVNIAVIGCGAIGGVTAAFMGKAGWDPEIVCKHRDMADRIISTGIHVFGVKGEHRVQLNAVKDIADLSGPKDVVFLATKAYDCVDAAHDLLPFLGPGSMVVSLQNGICEHALARVLGSERVVGCVVGWGASMHGPGELEVTSKGEFVIGAIDHSLDERLPLIRQILGSVMDTRISQNIMGELYSKLVINSCINSLGAVTGMNLGEMLAIKKVRNIFTALMREIMAVAGAMGIKVEPGGGGKLDYYRFLERRNAFAELKRHMTIRVMGFKYRRVRSSSLQSLERGRKTEIDYLNGYVCDRGRERGVDTPLNRAVVAMIKEIEDGSRRITQDNLNDPVFQEF